MWLVYNSLLWPTTSLPAQTIDIAQTLPSHSQATHNFNVKNFLYLMLVLVYITEQISHVHVVKSTTWFPENLTPTSAFLMKKSIVMNINEAAHLRKAPPCEMEVV